jgi:hypothetical protein
MVLYDEEQLSYVFEKKEVRVGVKAVLFVSSQDSVHCTLLGNGEIGEAAPSTQQISPTKPINGDTVASAPDQAKDPQITLGPQGILPPITLGQSHSTNSSCRRRSHKAMKQHENLLCL